MRYPIDMTHECDEDYFVPSPFCIPMPDGSMEDLVLPGSMIEEHVSKRLRHHRPFYCIPAPSPDVWKKKDGVCDGHRILVHRCYVTLENSVIVHDYIYVKSSESVTGWIQKYAAYYHTEKVLYPYDEFACEHLETKDKRPSPTVSSIACNILRSFSLPPPPSPQPLKPRTMKRIKPVKNLPLS